ncbi:ribosomal oxygenase 1 [Pogonomyrmex barbatus]|uniref:Bifunctional lysine-specific demethylase and histidyl-hydroxylase n=1 Tax=Pogonomyrmex barbatus TaxID=144034 RepID=A0A6I9WJX9_9HYME|nr:ribosomal oxygenase 1 [Pogonomyrmex barbatus]
MEQMSAFSVHLAKQKNMKQKLNNEKRKQGHNEKKLKNSNQKYKKNEDVQGTVINQQIQEEERKIKFERKLNAVNNGKKIDKELNRKLKNAIKKSKKKNKQIFKKKKITQMIDIASIKNIEKKDSKNISKNIMKKDILDSLNRGCMSDDEVHIDYIFKDPFQFSQELFQFLIHPLDVKKFFNQNWETKYLFVNRDKPDYYKKLNVSTAMLDKILRKKHVQFTKNIDITSYSSEGKELHNPPGRAHPSVVWDYYLNGCSIRMLNPQTFFPNVFSLNATLQEFFGCFVGANLYLTPPGSQGFAPHYDDVEVFILQLEGQKLWKLYTLDAKHSLPRYSSKDFDQEEIGEPILEELVKPGDLLYLPRGTIHQAKTLNDSHSLHLTISVYQKNSWCDFLEKLLPQALKKATENDVRFRMGLPLNFLKYIGSAYDTSGFKEGFEKITKNFIIELIKHIDIENVADLMAKDHIHDFLPPMLFKNEQKCSVLRGGKVMVENGYVKKCAKITLQTEVRLLRLHCIRLVKEDIYKIYYSTHNSAEYHEIESQYLEVDECNVRGIKQLIKSYPNFILLDHLLFEDDFAKVQIATDLWDLGLIITKEPI